VRHLRTFRGWTQEQVEKLASDTVVVDRVTREERIPGLSVKNQFHLEHGFSMLWWKLRVAAQIYKVPVDLFVTIDRLPLEQVLASYNNLETIAIAAVRAAFN
jgi:hypothetical protein